MKAMKFLILGWLMVLAVGCFESPETLFPGDDDDDSADDDDDDDDDDVTSNPSLGPVYQSGCYDDDWGYEDEDVAPPTTEGAEPGYDGETPDDPTSDEPVTDLPYPDDEGYYAGGGWAEFVGGRNRIDVFHYGAVVQCAAEMTFRMTMQGAEIVLHEVDQAEEQVRCVCSMDLQTSVRNLAPGQYYIELWNQDHTVLFGADQVYVGSQANQCSADWDCWEIMPDEALPDCHGDYRCIQGQCQFECYSDYECWSDSDCPEGYQCMFTYEGDDERDSVQGPSTDAYPSGGYCEPIHNPMYCWSNEDCPQGYVCEYYDYGYGDDDCECWSDENGTEECECPSVPEPGYGECVYQGEEYCYSNVDCPQGYVCEYQAWDCPEGYDCATVEYGICVPSGQEDCSSDYDCPEGYVCESATCVYEGNTTCYSDYDCPEGYFCEFQPWDCPDGYDCDTVMSGVCMPYENPEYCYSDRECNAGYHCELGEIPPCEAACWEDETGEVFCEEMCPDYAAIGICVPDENPTECRFDGDCGEGGTCVIDYCTDCMDMPGCGCFGHCEYNPNPTECYEGWDYTISCDAGYTCELSYCLDCEGPGCGCYGECVPEMQRYCSSDSDCSQGQICQMYDYADDGSVNSDPTMPYPMGVCVPGEEPVMCQTDEDCLVYSSVVYPDCLGGLRCQNNQCLFECAETVCGGYAGATCPEGQYCDYYPNSDIGTCRAEERGCYSDEECADGEFCYIDWDSAGNWNSDCGKSSKCIPEGVCLPREQAPCTMDSDCPEYMACMNGVCAYLAD